MEEGKEIKKIEKEGRSLEKEIKKLANNENVLIGIIIVLVLLVVAISFKPDLINSLKGDGKYNIEVIKLEGCENCFDLGLVTSLLSKVENVKIEERSLDYNSGEAKILIARYNIEKIPALIIKGKVDKLNLDTNIFRFGKGVAVFDKPVPYIDLKTRNKEGIVDAIEIYDSSCIDCTSLSKIEDSLEKTGIKIGNDEKIEANSERGRQLISENNLTFLSSLLLSKNVEEYWFVFPRIESLFYETDYYVLKNPIAPYKDILTGKVKGKVTITYITNESCEDCYDVTLLKDLFGSVGIYIDKEKFVDVSSSEGKSLLVSYNIKAIPTAILSKEVLDYNIKSTLERVGKFVNNEFVLEDLDSLNVKYQKTGQGG